MRKLFILSFLALWSAETLANSTVRLNPDLNVELVVPGTTNTNFILHSVKSTAGAAPTEAAPARVYVPMDGPGDQKDHFTVKGVNTLFTASSLATTISFPLYINVTATDTWMYVAIKDNATTKYKIAKLFSATPYNAVTNRIESFPVSSQEICQQAADCGNFASTSGTEKSYLAYFFLATNGTLATSTEIDPATYANGIYFEINMSNRIYTAAQVQPTITEIRPGDRRVIISYTSSTSIAKPLYTRVLNYGADVPGPINAPIQDYYADPSSPSLHPTEFAYSNEGLLTVNNLTNGETFNLLVVFVDLYKFGTVLSNHVTGEPKEIQELLEKNACFLLTAGFGEDHYVIDYFRNFRDHVLANSYLGKSFIHIYYELAPKYALVIYEHEGIRAFIRGAAYTLYFIFNFYYIFVAAFIGTATYLVYRKREKVRQA